MWVGENKLLTLFLGTLDDRFGNQEEEKNQDLAICCAQDHLNLNIYVYVCYMHTYLHADTQTQHYSGVKNSLLVARCFEQGI